MPNFETRDPTAPAFWDERFAHNFMPWDRAGVPAALRQFVARSPHPRVTLIPGCGTAHEVGLLAAAGWDVTAIDFSPIAVAAARAMLGPWAERVIEADFFTFLPPKPIELIYERAFLCALPRRLWPAVAARWAVLLPPGGLLVGYFFLDDTPKGPPFGIQAEELEALLTPNFERIENAAVADSVEVFAGREYWQVWRRLAFSHPVTA